MVHNVVVLASEDSELIGTAQLCAIFNDSQHYEAHLQILGEKTALSYGPLKLTASPDSPEPQTLAVTTANQEAIEIMLGAHETGARILGIGPGEQLVTQSGLIDVLTDDDAERLCKTAMARDLGISGTLNDPVALLMVEIRERPEQDWSLANMAERTGVSIRTLNRRFEAATGTSPGDFVTLRRLVVAERLLTENLLRIPDVAIKAGFGSADTLRHHFTRRYGHSPGTFRRNTRAQPE